MYELFFMLVITIVQSTEESRVTNTIPKYTKKKILEFTKQICK